MLPKDRAALELRLSERFETLKMRCTNDGCNFDHPWVSYDTLISLIVSMGWSFAMVAGPTRCLAMIYKPDGSKLECVDRDSFVALMLAFDQATMWMEVANAPQ